MIACPHCQGANNENARFCRHCGGPLYDQEYSSTRLPLGTVLDERYKIIDYVAKGGMGAVYKAVDLSRSAVWAVKEMLDYFDSEGEREYAVERFTTEAQILYDLEHESIPRFIDCFVSENRYYLIMEYIDGVDLRKKLEDELEQGSPGLNEEDVIRWAVKLCDVLDYLHRHDPPIIYRDMKPGNIMVTDTDAVFLIDFGIARLFDPRTKGTMVGTQGYAPPEQYRGEAEPRSDMYSLAACIHHLLSGKDPRNDIPFNFPPIKSLRHGLSDKIELILDKALSMDPRDRFRDMSHMKKALLAESFTHTQTYDSGELEYESPPTEDIGKAAQAQGLEIPELIRPEEESWIEPEDAGKLSYWYMFRSDRRHTGKSPFGRNVQGRIAWSFNAESPIRSSPVIGLDKTIYFGANNGNVYAVSPGGELLWTFKTKARIHSSPTLNSRGRVFIGSNDCWLYSLSAQGELLWKFRTYGRIKSSPCVGPDGTIYVGSYDHYLYALRPDGILKWRIDLGGYLQSTPAITDDGKIYVASKGAFKGCSFMYCLDGGGNIIWFSEIDAPIESSPCVTREGSIYIGGMDGNLYSYNSDGTLNWKYKAKGPIISSPVSNNGTGVMFGSFDKHIYSVNPEGELQWKIKTYSSVVSSPALSGDSAIFIGSDDYYMYSLSPQGEILWRVKFGGRVRSSPAIGEGDALYVGSDDGFLYSIE